MIRYGKQSIDHVDVEAVANSLTSDYLTQGPVKLAFEEALKAYCNVQHAVATSSGTSALHLACLSLSIGEGDWVWTSPISFLASANCARYCGAEVDFVDIDPRSGCMSPESLQTKLESTPRSDYPKAIVYVSYAGYSAGLADISKICRQYGIHLIEDACHGFGGEYKGQKNGACTFSDITIFSFHPIKTITTAEGGALVTNNVELANAARLLASHGTVKNESNQPWEYSMNMLGFNYRLSDVNCALGLSQIGKADSFVSARQEKLTIYRDNFSDIAHINNSEFISDSACHLASLSFFEMKSSLDFYQYMYTNGVQLQKHYIPIHKQNYYELRYGVKSYPQSEQFYNAQFTLPLYVELTESEQDHVIKLCKSYFRCGGGQ